MLEPFEASAPAALGVSLALHALNAALVYALTAALARGLAERRSTVQHISAAVAAFLFAMHPLRVEAVAWAAQQRLVLGVCGALLSTLLYVNGTHAARKWPWLLAAICCYVGSVAASLVALPLPLVLLVLDGGPLRRVRTRSVWLEKLPFFALGALGLTWHATEAAAPAALSPVEQLAHSAWNAVFYVWKTAWPTDLLPIYELYTPLKWSAPEYLAALGGVGVALAAGLALLRRAPGVATALLAYLALALPAAALLGDGWTLTADRFSYLPACVLSATVSLGITWLWQRREDTSRVWAGTLLLGALAFIAWVVPQTWRQAQLWRDPLTLWEYAAQHQPRGQRWSSIALYQLGCACENAGQPEAAEQNFRLAIQQRPALADARLRLAEVQLELMRVDAALATLRQAVAATPQNAEVHFRLGTTLAACGDLEAAATGLRQAVALDARRVAAHAALGRVLLLLDQPHDAAAELTIAIALRPSEAELHYDLGRACRAVGDVPRARSAFEQALALKPKHGGARRALSELDPATSQPGF